MADERTLRELLERHQISYRIEDVDRSPIRTSTVTTTSVTTKQKVVVILGMLSSLVFLAAFLYVLPKTLEQ